MSSRVPLHATLLPDEDQSWMRHIAWQSAALAPKEEASDVELGKAVDEVGMDAPPPCLATLLPPHLRFLHMGLCLFCATSSALAASGTVVDVGTMPTALGYAAIEWQFACWCSAGLSLWVELGTVLLFVAAGSAAARTCMHDRWCAFDAAVALLTSAALAAAYQQPNQGYEAAAGLLALRFGLRAKHASLAMLSEPAGSLSGSLSSSARCVPRQSLNSNTDVDVAFDTDMRFDTISNADSQASLSRPDLDSESELLESGSGADGIDAATSARPGATAWAARGLGLGSISRAAERAERAERGVGAERRAPATAVAGSVVLPLGQGPTEDSSTAVCGMEAVVARADSSDDWVCSACGAVNAGDDSNCCDCEASPSRSAAM